MNKPNYYKIMLSQLKSIQDAGRRPKVLLHSCCAPCSSSVLKLMSELCDLEIYFFNPNIYPEDEYMKRMKEQIRLVQEMGLPYHVVETPHDAYLFYDAVKGYEKLGEGSERCFRCFRVRLEKAAKYAKGKDFDFFTTTLTVSPLKNTQKLNEIGQEVGEEFGVTFLHSDFKKNDGYKKSVELSKQYNLYRQNYCGCVFSKKEREEQMARMEQNEEKEHKCETCGG